MIGSVKDYTGTELVLKHLLFHLCYFVNCDLSVSTLANYPLRLATAFPNCAAEFLL